MMKLLCLIPVVSLAALLGACSEEPPPAHSVAEFMENSILLEATMVRCARDRTRMKYDVDCMNARDAVNRIEASQEEERRKELEAQFERKRRALRRTQEAAAEARRRAAEEQRRREEAEYLGIYEATPGPGEGQAVTAGAESSTTPSTMPSTTALEGNQPGASVAVEPATGTGDDGTGTSPTTTDDINAVREELRRRREGGN